MCHQSVDAEVWIVSERRDEFTELIETNTETPHARIDLHMHIRDNTRFTRGLIERVEHVAPVNDRSQVVLNARRRLSRPETSETQHGVMGGGVARFDRLFRQRDAAPVSVL